MIVIIIMNMIMRAARERGQELPEAHRDGLPTL
jgi:hypothetical protein